MLKRQKWTDHKFAFDIDIGWDQNIITRISDISIRCHHLCHVLNNELLSHRIKNKWSIKEHIGHLIDLEDLHCLRLKEFNDFKEELTAADMSNHKTEKADHNKVELKELLTELSRGRESFIRTYHMLTEESRLHQSLHPRLKQFMRPVDLLYFVGEHDDHHLCTMKINKEELLKMER